MFSLPCNECRGRCCTYPVFSAAEFQIVKVVRGIPAGAIVKTMQFEQMYDKATYGRGTTGHSVIRPGGECAYLVDGKCSIYNIRPKVCRDYGVVPDLPCEYLYPKAAEAKQLERIKQSRL